MSGAEWQPLSREYGITYYSCSACNLFSGNRYGKCPKCKEIMKNGDNSAAMDALYNKSAAQIASRLYWAAERKKGIQMKRGGKWSEKDERK